MYNDFLHDCKNEIYGVGDTVHYINKKGELCYGVVTRIRVEIDYKTLQNVKKVKVNYANLKKIEQKIKKEIQDA